MAVPKPNHQKLVVTNKQKQSQPQPEYATDMRTIEQWANEGIVRSLHAGTGVTLDPSDGVDQGLGITINASGGGGGTTTGVLSLGAGPDINDQSGVQMLGPSEYTISVYESRWPFNSTGSVGYGINISSSWFVQGNAGDSMCLFPIITAPMFTPAIGFNVLVSVIYISVSSLDMLNSGVWYTPLATYPLQSNATVQPPASDFVALFGGPFGVDLSLVAGTGSSGNGIVSAAGSIPYLANVNMRIFIEPNTTMT